MIAQPADDQAIGRANRNDKPVFAQKRIIEYLVEEKILALQGKKKTLSNVFYSEKEEAFRYWMRRVC